MKILKELKYRRMFSQGKLVLHEYKYDEENGVEVYSNRKLKLSKKQRKLYSKASFAQFKGEKTFALFLYGQDTGIRTLWSPERANREYRIYSGDWKEDLILSLGLNERHCGIFVGQGRINSGTYMSPEVYAAKSIAICLTDL